MKKLLLALLLGAAGASAATVSYGTDTSELCFNSPGCGVLQQDIGSLQVVYTPVPLSTVTANPSASASFGLLEIICVNGNTACPSQVLDGLNLYIVLKQTLPVPGNGSIAVGSITGSVNAFSSTATIAWSLPSTSIGAGANSITYEVLASPIALNPPEVNFGTTEIRARITSNSIPESSTYLMLATGLVALGLVNRRRPRS
ncbi:MAG: PEP-CTERM sorting domain-containing protein [Acidobacteriota bacterium]|jgi:hypothetical protein|nr:PEP-CTERM sorting domain-containing protein [Acidobacteriaceae bacterium]